LVTCRYHVRPWSSRDSFSPCLVPRLTHVGPHRHQTFISFRRRKFRPPHFLPGSPSNTGIWRQHAKNSELLRRRRHWTRARQDRSTDLPKESAEWRVGRNQLHNCLARFVSNRVLAPLGIWVQEKSASRWLPDVFGFPRMIIHHRGFEAHESH
jgi:hypothetical protein